MHQKEEKKKGEEQKKKITERRDKAQKTLQRAEKKLAELEKHEQTVPIMNTPDKDDKEISTGFPAGKVSHNKVDSSGTGDTP
jgi:hypothetical protein